MYDKGMMWSSSTLRFCKKYFDTGIVITLYIYLLFFSFLERIPALLVAVGINITKIDVK